MRCEFGIAGEARTVGVSRRQEGFALHLGERTISAAWEPLGNGRFRLALDGRTAELTLASSGDTTFVHLDGQTWEIERRDPAQAAAAGEGGGAGSVIAPMPGTVISVAVEPGEKVVRGQALMVIESMKLETTISADADAVVGEIHYQVGDTFPLKAALISLEPAAGDD